MAIVSGVESIVRLHVSRIKDVNARDGAGMSPLMIAAAKGNASICRLLLEVGADLLLRNKDGRDALALARLSGKQEVEEVLQAHLEKLHRHEPLIDTCVVEVTPLTTSTQRTFEDPYYDAVLDISAWEDEPDSIPPIEDSDCISEAQRSYHRVSAHVPINTDDDWSDVDIELPEIQIDALGKYSLSDSTWLALRELFLLGNTTGRIFQQQIDSLIDSDENMDSEIVQNVLLVLGEIGILVDDWVFEDGEPEICEYESEDDEDHERLVNETINFLRVLWSPTNDPWWYHLRSTGKFSRLSGDQECALAKQIEDGMKSIIHAVSSCPLILQQVLDIFDQVARGVIRITDLVHGFLETVVLEEELAPDHNSEDAFDPGGISNDQDHRNRIEPNGVQGFKAEVDDSMSRIRDLHAQVVSLRTRSSIDDDIIIELQEQICNELLKYRFTTKFVSTISIKMGFLHEFISEMESESHKGAADQQVIPTGCRGGEFPTIAANPVYNKGNAGWGLQTNGKIGLVGSADSLTAPQYPTGSNNFIPAPLKEIKKVYKQIVSGSRMFLDARSTMVEANMRLVAFVARKYSRRGMDLMDLVQEGAIGLMKAVDRFDYHRGFKFSTYAMWWIRQAITRAIADQSRLIRLPVHMFEKLNKTSRVMDMFEAETGHIPNELELSDTMSLPVEEIRKYMALLQEPLPLHEIFDDDADSPHARTLKETASLSPEDITFENALYTVIQTELESIPKAMSTVLKLRFGLEDSPEHTLEEIGHMFGVTRERIRQIEAKAIQKMQHKSRSTKLQDFN